MSLLLLLLLTLAVAYNYVPDEMQKLVRRRPWLRSDDGECVVVDAYVRRYTRTLLISTIGPCVGLRTDNAWCELQLADGQSHRMQKVVRISKSAETHAGAAVRKGAAPKYWPQQVVDCGSALADGSVTLQFGDTTIGPLEYALPSEDADAGGVESTQEIALCTRVYDTLGWEPLNTVLFIEWLEWQWALGVGTVHLYVIDLNSTDMWRAIAAYAATPRLVVHIWNDAVSAADGAVARSWEYAQPTYLLDCFARLEGRALYMGAFDHDEYLQPVGGFGTLSDALDAHFATRATMPNVAKIDPFTAVPRRCDGVSVERTAYVLSFCNGHDNNYKRTKYFIRSSAERPFYVPLDVHAASDGSTPLFVARDKLQLVHLGRVALLAPDKYKRVPTPWSAALAKSVYDAIARNKQVAPLYTELRKPAASAAALVSAPCFALIDAGAGDGDTLRKAVVPSQFPRSGFAAAIGAMRPQNYTCRHLFAFEADAEAIERLRDVCAEVLHNNFTCSAYSGVLGASHGTTKVYSDAKTRGKLTYSTLPTKIELLAPGVEVPMYGFVPLLRAAVTLADFVVVKLDVEGSEFDLLHALVRSFGACSLIDVLLVEWHDGKYSATSRQRKLLEERYGDTLEHQKAELLAALKECRVDVREGERVTD